MANEALQVDDLNLEELVPAETAVIVVDMQNDFGSTGGMIHQTGEDLGRVRQAIAPTRRVLAAARSCGTQIVYLQHGYAPDLSDVGPHWSKNWAVHQACQVGRPVEAPDGRQSAILIRGTWNTEIIPELAPQPDDVVIGKTRFSGFYGTELETVLRTRGIRNLLVVGWTTSDCVDSTVRDAFFRDFRVVVVRDCVAEVHGDEYHDASLHVLSKMFAWLRTSDDVVAWADARKQAVTSREERAS